jgi:hypothetical protein
MQFYGAEDDVFSLITKFILNDGQSFQEMNSRLVNYLGDYTDIDSSAEGTYLYNYKELLRLKHEFEQVNKKLENILNEKYRTESYREQESTERFSTAISLYESYSEKLYELLTGQIEENVKSLTFTLDDVKSEESIDLKMESIYQQLDQSLRNNAKKVNDEMSKLDSAKKELKKQIIDFYIKSGSSYLDIDDPQSKLGKKLKMVDDLGNKFSELETEFFDIQDGVITKFILGACDKLIKMVEAEPKEKDAEQKIKQKIEKEFEVLIKDGKNVVFNNFQKKLNQFIEYYRKNYNKRYESEGFLLAPDYIVKYGENKYLKLEQEINQFLASPSLTMRNLLPRNLYVDFTDEFLRKPKERD